MPEMFASGYGRVAYEPPVPHVFGQQAEIELPKYEQGPSTPASIPHSRMKLKDRLALYEEDDPQTQKYICCLGFLCPPFIWTVGAIMYFWTPKSKTLTREVGYKNLLLAAVSTALIIGIWMLHELFEQMIHSDSTSAEGGSSMAALLHPALKKGTDAP